MSAGQDRNICAITGHLQFLVKVSGISLFFAKTLALLAVMTCELSIASPPVSDSKKKRQPDSTKHSDAKERGRTPAQGTTASFLQPQLHRVDRVPLLDVIHLWILQNWRRGWLIRDLQPGWLLTLCLQLVLGWLGFFPLCRIVYSIFCSIMLLQFVWKLSQI